jgi:DivIVA domain-containing protein
VALVLLTLVAVAVVLAVLAVASGRWPVDPLAAPVRSTPDHGLPDVPRSTDVDGVRFDTAARGYRQADVDARLAALRDALAEREHDLGVETLRRGHLAEPAEQEGRDEPAPQAQAPVRARPTRPVEG